VVAQPADSSAQAYCEVITSLAREQQEGDLYYPKGQLAITLARDFGSTNAVLQDYAHTLQQHSSHGIFKVSCGKIFHMSYSWPICVSLPSARRIYRIAMHQGSHLACHTVRRSL
jgi:hypothetical protein